MIQIWWSCTPSAPTMKPPPKQTAEANIASRGPAASSQRPKVNAERPRKTIAVLKIQPIVESFQSAGAGLSIPTSVESGRLKTLKAYAWPMARWIARAAGGTRQRLNPGGAIECWRSGNMGCEVTLSERREPMRRALLVLFAPILLLAQTPRTQIVMLGTGTPIPDPDRMGPSVAVIVDSVQIGRAHV